MFGLLPTMHVLRRVLVWMALILPYVVGVTLVVRLLELPMWPAGNEILATLAVAAGVMLVFRNNAAYARWWEARQLWGQLINETRNLALKARAHAAVDADERRRFARLLVGFAHALRLHLRGGSGPEGVPGFGQETAKFPHAPGYLAGLIHQTLDRWNRQGKLADTVWLLDRHARALMDVCGGCERIRNTPLASSYRALWRWGIALYVAVSPWVVAAEFGWWDLPVLTLGFGFLFGVELTAEDVEEPFGTDGDDLPLETYCGTIETFVTAALESPWPEPAREDEPARRGPRD